MPQNSDSNDQNFQQSGALGSPNETENTSAQDSPSFDDSKSEIINFFDHDYISNLGANSENSADDKEDLSDLPTFLDEEPEKKDNPDEKDGSALVDDNPDNSQADEEKKGEESEEGEGEEADDSAESQDSDKTSETEALTDEEKKSIPKSKWEDYRRAKARGRTEAKFLDPTEKMGDFLGHLEQKSPARMNELRKEVLLSSVTNIDEAGNRSVDGNKLLSALYTEIGEENYTDVVNSIVENYADHAAKLLKEKGFVLVKEGDLSQSSTETPQINDEQLNSILQEAEMYLDDDKVELLRSVLTSKVASEEKQADDNSPAEIAAQTAEESSDNTAENKQTETEEKFKTPEPPPEVIQNWNNAVNESLPIVDQHLNTILNSTYGLEVSEIERTNIPELADLKDEKRDIVFYGTRDGKLPSFDIGLIERFREDDTFKQSFDRFKYFAEKGEINNAQNAIREILPFAEKYLGERLNHDLVKRKDAAIKRIADSVNGREQSNVHFSGGSNLSGGGNGGGGNSESNSFLNPESL